MRNYAYQAEMVGFWNKVWYDNIDEDDLGGEEVDDEI
jgi:hypothetical protein